MFGWIIKIVPLLVVAVKAIEEAADGWTGEEKKASAIEFIRVAAEQLGIRLPEGALETIGKMIDALVAAFNVIGAFRHGDKDVGI